MRTRLLARACGQRCEDALAALESAGTQLKVRRSDFTRVESEPPNV